MGNFSDGFEEYLPPSQQEVEDLLKRALIVLDTNVLLDLYRFAKTARTELFDAFGKLGDRLWIPHQVALEFHRNRAAVVTSHDDAYRSVLKEITELDAAFQKGLAQEIRRLANRAALDDAQRDSLLKHVQEATNKLKEEVTELRASHGVSETFLHDDAVLHQLGELLDGKVGDALTDEEGQLAREEGLRRVEANEPPGFKDSVKDDPSGDYMLWVQGLAEAKSRNSSLLFVTRDSKSDWFEKVNGKTVAALPDLVREAQKRFGVRFVAMSTKSFLVHSRRVLGTSVSDATLRQAESLRSPRSTELQFTKSVLGALSVILPAGNDLETHRISNGFEFDAAISRSGTHDRDLSNSVVVETVARPRREKIKKDLQKLASSNAGRAIYIVKQGPFDRQVTRDFEAFAGNEDANNVYLLILDLEEDFLPSLANIVDKALDSLERDTVDGKSTVKENLTDEPSW
ncbi:PIN-like domain-containing protein [Jidongwangia harbinensis]|uniref:PIN-like domain-containing protein n=1 Tax=Jidongwangia harbinensis TaxID=2878561 RepID=UPI001CD9E571|nr:PIN domain-containing protein [Jidongwangia harbinensis]MCA2215635.1 PIN domain-containing protein [Jidongwangia harbinensis]